MSQHSIVFVRRSVPPVPPTFGSPAGWDVVVRPPSDAYPALVALAERAAQTGRGILVIDGPDLGIRLDVIVAVLRRVAPRARLELIVVDERRRSPSGLLVDPKLRVRFVRPRALAHLLGLSTASRPCGGARATGIQVPASENWTLVGPAPDDLDPVAWGFPVDANGDVLNPDTWTFDLVAPDRGPRLGQMVLVNPSEQAGLRFENCRPLYLGHHLGCEHWQWHDEAWPRDGFDLVDVDHVELLVDYDPARGPAVQMGTFAAEPGRPRESAVRAEYQIRTGPPGEELPVGFFQQLESGDQVWFADPEGLIDGLVPPGPGGVWQFRRPDPGEPLLPTMVEVVLSGVDPG